MKIIKRSKKQPDIYEYEVKNGVFWGYRLKYYDQTNKRKEIKRHQFESERDAFESYIDNQSFINKGKLSKFNSVTLNEWFKQHVDLNKPDESGLNGKWSLNTYHNRIATFEKYILPYIGHMKLREISLNVYETQVINQIKRVLSASTIALYHRYVMICMNGAVRYKLLDENPLQGATLPQSIEIPKDKYLDEEQLLAVFEDVRLNENITNRMLVMLLAYTGMRKGEARGLKWKNIIFKKNHIQVYGNMTRHGYGPTKGRNKRIVATEKTIMNLLQDYKKWCIQRAGEILTEEDFVLITPQKGTVIGDSTISYLFERISKRVGFHVQPHTLRHTHSALLIKMNRSLKVISKRLGNSEEVLSKHYGHVIDSADVDTMEAFNDAISTGAPTGADSNIINLKSIK